MNSKEKIEKTESIRKYGDPILVQKTKKIVDPLSKEIQALIPVMFASMRAANGVGLAAPQIGQGLRICVIEEGGKEYVLINPKISTFSKEKIVMEEGCLSFPGEFFDIERPQALKVHFLNQDGKQVKMKANGLLARAIQHEIDHLDGILIIDRIKDKKKRKNYVEKNTTAKA